MIAFPNKLDGSSCAKANVYSSQVGIYVVSKLAIFPNDRSKVVFSLSYLTGVARRWAQPFTQRVFTGNEGTYNKFTVAFLRPCTLTPKRKAGQRRPYAH